MPQSATTPDQDIIAEASAAKLGDDRAAAPVDKATQAEASAALLSPTTEGDKVQTEAVVYDVPFGESTRQLTPKQIESTYGRYATLNHDHAQNKDVLELVKSVIGSAKEQGTTVTSAQVSQFLQAAAQAYVKNPTMGGQAAPADPGGMPRSDISINAQAAAAAGANPGDYDADLTRWEEDNGVSLPPGFREQATGMRNLALQNAQLAQIVQRLSQGQQAVTQGGQKAVAEAKVAHVDALRQSAVNNLDRAQQAAGLPNDMQDAFFQFASERGYSFEDFIDAELASTAIRDFKAVADAPELERLRSTAKRRQAFTGVEGSPSGGDSVNKSTPDQDFFNGLVNNTLETKTANNTL